MCKYDDMPMGCRKDAKALRDAKVLFKDTEGKARGYKGLFTT
jgi:hypothetical protein